MRKKPEIFEEGEGRKPYMILDYNSTKGAVDSFDQQVDMYSCAHKTRRWPMRLFYFIIDASCHNSFVIWDMKHPKWKDQPTSRRLDKRRLYITEAAYQLMKPMTEARAQTPNISHMPSVSRAMLAVGVQPKIRSETATAGKKRGRCQSCPRKQEQKVNHTCLKCHEFVCGKHATKKVAFECIPCPLRLDLHDNNI
jgi:Transposase IS4